MKTSSQDILITKNGLYTNDNQQENDINTVTAETADSNIKNLNDPNLMSVIEKQTAVSQFYGLTSQYNVLVQNAKDDGIDTTAVTTAYNNLNRFMADILADPDHASDIDRVAYKKYQDAYNQELANIQNALQNNANSKFASAASAASSAAIATSQAFSAADSAYNYANSEIAVQSTATAKAQSTADNAFSQAQAVGSQASAEIVVQSTATAKAQSTADNAFSQAKTAIDTGQAVSEAVTALKDGSTLTIAQLGNGLAEKVSNSEYASYKEHTASQIGEMVTNGAFTAYQQTTADLISSKVATKDFSAYQDTTAKAISSKVESKDFNTYKTQTANTIASKVDNGNFSTYQKQTAELIGSKVDNGAYQSDKKQTADLIAEKVANSDFSTYKTQTADLISAKVETKDFSSYKDETAKAISSKVESKDFNTYKTQTADVLQTLVSRSPSNIIKDGGFNSADNVGKVPSGWNFNNNMAQIVVNSDQINGLVAAGRSVLQINSKPSGNSDIYYGDWFDVQPGDQFYTEFKVRWSTMSQKGTIVIGLETCDAEWRSIYWPGGASTSHPATWTKYTGITTVGANAAHARVWVSWQGSSAANEAVFVTDLVVRPAYATQSQITQLSDDINFRVKKDDLISQINIQARNTLISSGGQLTLSGKNVFIDSDDPVIMKSANIDKLLVGKKLTAADISANTFTTNNGTFTVDKNGAITAKNMTINGGTINTPTLNLGMNGTFTESYDYTQATGWFLPKKATGSVTFNHGVIEDQGTMQSYINGVWGGISDSLQFTAGITNNVWTEYAPGYYKIDMYKQGSTTDVLQRTYADPTGYYYSLRGNGVTSYLGNVLSTPQVQTGGVLAEYIGPGKGTLRLQIGQNGKDYGLQVGSYANKEAVLSDFIYSSTTSGSPNVHIDMYGRLLRSTSASKYKYNIKNPDIETTLGDRLLNVRMATWNDKRAVDMYAEELSTGEKREKSSIDKYYGLIAEQLRDAGLDMFISYGKNHEIEGIQYDRAWIPLLSVIRRLNDKVNEYELRLSKLEGTNK